MNVANKLWIPHPGEYVKEELEARGWSQRDLSYILGCPEQSINVIISGKRGISPDMAKAFADAFCVSAEFFANLQKAYDLSRAPNPDPGISKRAKLQSVYPIREMIKRGWLENVEFDSLDDQVAKFFEVNNVNKIPYMAHAAKKTDYEKKNIDPIQLAWLFRIRQIAKSMVVPKYSENRLRESINKLKELLIDPEMIKNIPKILSDCGVRYIVSESLPKGKIDGVCFWLDKHSPVIGMSLRFDRIDNFWFVLRHELEHVLQGHGQESEMIDVEIVRDYLDPCNDLPEEERIANVAAENFCVPKVDMENFIRSHNPYFSEKEIVKFSNQLQICPGLVVGQIQHKIEKYNFLKKYLVNVRKHLLPYVKADGWGYSI